MLDKILESKKAHLASLKLDRDFPHVLENTLKLFEEQWNKAYAEEASTRVRFEALKRHAATLDEQILAAQDDVATYAEHSKDRMRNVVATQATDLLTKMAAMGISIDDLQACLNARPSA